MMESRGFFNRHRRVHRMGFEIFERTLHIPDQQRPQIAAHAVAHQNTLNGLILTIGGQRVSRDLPAAPAQPVGKIIEAEPGINPVLHLPAERRNTAAHITAVDHLEGPQLVHSLAEKLRGLVAGGVNFLVTFPAHRRKL